MRKDRASVLLSTLALVIAGILTADRLITGRPLSVEERTHLIQLNERDVLAGESRANEARRQNDLLKAQNDLISMTFKELKRKNENEEKIYGLAKPH